MWHHWTEWLRWGLHNAVLLSPKESQLCSYCWDYLSLSAQLSYYVFLWCCGSFLLVCPLLHGIRYELSADKLAWKQSSIKLPWYQAVPWWQRSNHDIRSKLINIKKLKRHFINLFKLQRNKLLIVKFKLMMYNRMTFEKVQLSERLDWIHKKHCAYLFRGTKCNSSSLNLTYTLNWEKNFSSEIFRREALLTSCAPTLTHSAITGASPVEVI